MAGVGTLVLHSRGQSILIESVAKLPDLFETLITRVADMTVKLRVRNEQAKELLAAVNATAAELESSKDEK